MFTGPPLLLLTIDVEEDMPGWQIADPTTVDNVHALPAMHDACARLGVRPTYLCTYPMVTLDESATVLRELLARGDCELGTHLHPWNTPPFTGLPGHTGDERRVPYYQSQLGAERFRAKLAELHGALTDLSGAAPTSFRAGRFGIDAVTLRELLPLGYEVDSSVTPLDTHRGDGFGPDFRRAPRFPYFPSHDDVGRRGDLDIVEVPVSVGVTRQVPKLLLSAFVHLPPALRLRGILSSDYLGVLDFAWLYPARFDLAMMKALARTLVKDGNPVLNVFLHSNELADGRSGRLKGAHETDGAACIERTRELLAFCIEEFCAQPATLTAAARRLRPVLKGETGCRRCAPGAGSTRSRRRPSGRAS